MYVLGAISVNRKQKSAPRIWANSFYYCKEDQVFLKQHLDGFEFLGFLPFDNSLIEADLKGISPFDMESAAGTIVAEISTHL